MSKISVGLDLGMVATKLWGDEGGLQVLSQVASDGTRHLSDGIVGLKTRARPMRVQFEMGSFYVGDRAHEYGRPVENLDFDRLTGAPEMRALFYGSLAQYQDVYGPFDGPISLMAGLPLQMMMGDGASAYQEGVKKWLKGAHRFDVDGSSYEVEIEAARLTSQPVGALFDYVVEGGEIQRERAHAMLDEVGVISVGFNTLELLVVKNQGAVERFTAGNTVGVRRLLELINRDGLYSLVELDAMLRANRLRDEVKLALPIWTREVNGEIEKRWGGSYRRFVRVLVVGGGALLLKEALTGQFNGKAWVPDEPVLSIARGLWKLAGLRK